ncbi:MAG: hypothetical protein ACU0GG_21440 [Paracoccaceae bacterium]
MITRRALSKLALSSALVAQASPAPAFFHRSATPEDWAARLTDDLNAALKSNCTGRFEVLWFDHRDTPFSVMEAGIRLHWPPGIRGKAFVGTGDDGDAAVEKLRISTLEYFRKVWTYPDGRSCFV